MHQCWLIVIKENTFENVVCNMATICLGLSVLNFNDLKRPITAHMYVASLCWLHVFVPHNDSTYSFPGTEELFVRFEYGCIAINTSPEQKHKSFAVMESIAHDSEWFVFLFVPQLRCFYSAAYYGNTGEWLQYYQWVRRRLDTNPVKGSAPMP